MWDFLRHLNATCEDISELVSQSLDQDLPRSRRWAIHLHLLYCKACRRYRAQMRHLREVFRSAEPPDPQPADGISPEARERMKRVLGEPELRD